jgi:putative transposase
MDMQYGVRFRAYPPASVAARLKCWIGCQRFVKNAKVREDRYFRRFSKAALSLTGTRVPIDQQYSQFKTELTPFLNEVPSQILRNGAYLFKQAYTRYFAGLG